MKVEGIDKESYYLIRVGEYLSTESLIEVRDEVDKAVQLGRTSIAFDMSSCSDVDSSGIALLVSLYKKCTTMGGGIYVLKPSKYAQDVLMVANMESLVKFVDTEQEIAG